MDKLQVCKETKELWTEMARFAREEGKLVEKADVEGPWKDYVYNCPCCQYKGFLDCVYCPMYKEWTFYSDLDDAPCQGKLSPYQRWRTCRLSSPPVCLCIDVEFFCLLIAEMADEARMRHIAESQPSLVKDKDIEYVSV